MDDSEIAHTAVRRCPFTRREIDRFPVVLKLPQRQGLRRNTDNHPLLYIFERCGHLLLTGRGSAAQYQKA